MRIDKVTRKLALGFKKVYSLVLDERGLFIIRTGNVGALQHYEMSSIVNQVAAGAVTNAFVKQLEAGEAKLTSTPLEELAEEKANAFMPLAEIQSVKTKLGKAPEMKLETNQGKFNFIFTHTPVEQVEAFERALIDGTAG
ncbi:MAG: hypothetical protein ACOC7Y_01715 [Chloroflexota bacterium]